MMRGFWTARTGMIQHEMKLGVVANNFANVNTVGFKPTKVSFTDLMYQNINRPNAEGTAMVGHGVKINKTDIVFTQGALAPGTRLDFAITVPNGFFAVQDPFGNIQYTRNGSFIMSTEDGETFYLAAGNGDRVLDADGGHIELEFDERGELILVPHEDIGVFTFPNHYGLHSVANTRFVPSGNSGEATEVENVRDILVQGYTEDSSVEMAMEMVRVIHANRAFAFNSRIITIADELEQTVNQLR